jgi:hypothetical protein
MRPNAGPCMMISGKPHILTRTRLEVFAFLPLRGHQPQGIFVAAARSLCLHVRSKLHLEIGSTVLLDTCKSFLLVSYSSGANYKSPSLLPVSRTGYAVETTWALVSETHSHCSMNCGAQVRRQPLRIAGSHHETDRGRRFFCRPPAFRHSLIGE